MRPLPPRATTIPPKQGASEHCRAQAAHACRGHPRRRRQSTHDDKEQQDKYGLSAVIRPPHRLLLATRSGSPRSHLHHAGGALKNAAFEFVLAKCRSDDAVMIAEDCAFRQAAFPARSPTFNPNTPVIASNNQQRPGVSIALSQYPRYAPDPRRNLQCCALARSGTRDHPHLLTRACSWLANIAVSCASLCGSSISGPGFNTRPVNSGSTSSLLRIAWLCSSKASQALRSPVK